MALMIYAQRRDKNCVKTLIVAEYVGEKVDLAPNFRIGLANKSPQFFNMNPLRHGMVPLLETPDGPIFKSNAIARYVARRKGANSLLFGSSLIDHARVDQWIEFAACDIDVHLVKWFHITKGKVPDFSHVFEEARVISKVKQALAVLDMHLASKSDTYLVGNSVTLADIIMICDLLLGFNRLMTKRFTSKFPHVEKYFWTLVNQPNFKKILGEVKQASTWSSITGTRLHFRP